MKRYTINKFSAETKIVGNMEKAKSIAWELQDFINNIGGCDPFECEIARADTLEEAEKLFEESKSQSCIEFSYGQGKMILVTGYWIDLSEEELDEDGCVIECTELDAYLEPYTPLTEFDIRYSDNGKWIETFYSLEDCLHQINTVYAKELGEEFDKNDYTIEVDYPDITIKYNADGLII